MTLGHWILDGIDPIPVELDTWATWFQAADNWIAKDWLEHFSVSTVFLGLDHNFHDHGPPLIFETMVFANGGWMGEWMMRSSTYHEAMTAHELAMLYVSETTFETQDDVDALFARLGSA